MYLDVTFFPSNSMFGTALLMNGKGELHLTETALVSEGNRAKFSLPFGMMTLYQNMLASWATITVPYSQVVRHRYSGYWVSLSFFKFVLILFLAVLAVAAGAMIAFNQDETHRLIGIGVLAMLAFLTVFVLMHGRRQHRVVFRLSNGKRTTLVFRIKGPPRQTREEFSRLLDEYLAVARTFDTNATET